MYKERKNNFEVKDIILQISFVVLFVFLLIWLFPTKSFGTKVEKSIDTYVFSENIKNMREAAANYYSGVKIERLPVNVGDTAKLTLKEMIDLKLILPFGADSASCDLTKSYVEITRETVGYVIKTNLKCGAKEDYVLVNVCPVACVTCVVKPIVKPIVYEYQYVKRTNGTWSDWSAFSAWSTTVAIANDAKKIETKTVAETVSVDKQVIDYYNTKTVQIGTKEVFDHFDSIEVQTGTKSVTTSTLVYTNKVYASGMSNTSTTTYEPKGVIIGSGCNGCVNTVNYIYDVYAVTTKLVPIYGTEQVAVYKTVALYDTITEAVYKTVKELVNKDVQYYRYSTRTYTNGTVSYKWSKSNKDTSLTSIGYTLTGLKRAI